MAFADAGAVQSVVLGACADVEEELNGMCTDPSQRLPTEVLVECFGFLPFKGRIAVSHVSRAWRRVSLAARNLWTEASLWPLSRLQPTKLSVLLSRSHPLPFRLTWNAFYASDGDRDALDIMELMTRNMYRMQYLSMGTVPSDALLDIFSRPAPLLQDLVIDNGPACFCTLPAQWGCLIAPRLRSLDVGVFGIPYPFEPLLSLREFWGNLDSWRTVGPDDIGLPHLFEIFPNLVSLGLFRVTDNDVSLLRNVPPSVVDIVLTGLAGVGVDFVSFIDNRMGATVRKLRTHWACNIPATVDAFTTKVSGTWSMTVSSVDYHNSVTLKGDDDRIVYVLDFCKNGWWSSEDHPFTCSWDRLASLTISLNVIADLCDDEEVVWDRYLPSLRHLTITVDSYFDGTKAQRLVTHPTHYSPIRAPQLDAVTLTDVLSEIAVTVPAAIPLLISCGGPRLNTLWIETPHADRLRNRELDSLADLARRVQIKCGRTGRIVFDVSDGEILLGK